jgi:hypothetical protein
MAGPHVRSKRISLGVGTPKQFATLIVIPKLIRSSGQLLSAERVIVELLETNYRGFVA